MVKWLSSKRLNIIQVIIYWIVVMVYLLSIKVEWFSNINFTILIIGAILSIMIMLIRFIYSDQLDKKLQQ